jgi:hypothetical protein
VDIDGTNYTKKQLFKFKSPRFYRTHTKYIKAQKSFQKIELAKKTYMTEENNSKS